MTRARSGSMDAAAYTSRSKPFGSAVRDLKEATLLTVRTRVGVDCYMLTTGNRPDLTAKAAQVLAHAVGAKAEATDEHPDTTGGPVVAQLVARPNQSASRDTQAGADPSEVAQAITRTAEPGSWLAVTLRAPSGKEVDRAREWNHRRNTSYTHHSLDSEVLVASFYAGAGNARAASFLLGQVVAALPGMDVDVVTRVRSDTPLAAGLGVTAGASGAVGAGSLFTEQMPGSNPQLVAYLAELPLLPGGLAAALPLGALSWAVGTHRLPTAPQRLARAAKNLVLPRPATGGRVPPKPKPPQEGQAPEPPPNPYPLASTSFLVGPSVVAGVVAPQGGAEAGAATTGMRGAPPALRADIGPMIGTTGTDQPVHTSAADRTAGTILLGIPDAGKALAVDQVVKVGVCARFPGGFAAAGDLVVGDVVDTPTGTANVTVAHDPFDGQLVDVSVRTRTGVYTVTADVGHLWKVARPWLAGPDKKTRRRFGQALTAVPPGSAGTFGTATEVLGTLGLSTQVRVVGETHQHLTGHGCPSLPGHPDRFHLGDALTMLADLYGHRTRTAIVTTADLSTGDRLHPWGQVESVGEPRPGRARCITIDAPDGMFLVGVDVPTHNSVAVRALYAWNVLERVTPSGKPGRPGRANTLIAFENKGEGAGEYISWGQVLGDHPLRIDLADPDTPAVDLFAGPDSPAGKAKQVAEAMQYAFPAGSIQRQSLSTLTLVLTAAQMVTDEVAGWAGLPPGLSVVEHAATLLGASGDESGVKLATALTRAHLASDDPVLAEAVAALAPMYGEKTTAAQRRQLQDAPRTKVETLVEAKDWFAPDRPRLPWARVLGEHDNVVVNTGISAHGALVSAEVTSVMGSMLLYTLKDAVQRTCSGWKDAGRSVSVFVDELALLAADSPEVVTWFRNQGRSYGLAQYLATQYPDQLHEDVRKAVLSFGTIYWFRQANPQIAGMAADMLSVDGSDWAPSDVYNLPAHTAIVTAQVDKTAQPAVPVRIGYWEPDRSSYPQAQGYPAGSLPEPDRFVTAPALGPGPATQETTPAVGEVEHQPPTVDPDTPVPAPEFDGDPFAPERFGS